MQFHVGASHVLHVSLLQVSLAVKHVQSAVALLDNGAHLLLFIQAAADETGRLQDDVMLHIKHNLPPHYKPDDILVLSSMPMTSHGKLLRLSYIHLFTSVQIKKM